ncbi:hypothetical protein E4695_13005 [Alcaligenaceae bacterium 429]|nr:hypothetical protein E4695_13005 [Alcaligenaceae bacterium 429]
MKILYTTKHQDIPAGLSVRNPQYFEKPEQGVKAVYVDGDYPNIVQAYQGLGVDVEVVTIGDAEQAPVDPTDMGLPALRKHLKALGIEFDPKATKDELLALLPPKE